jgi:hypothetical protein
MTRVFALLGLSRLGATNPDLHPMMRDACSSICSDIDMTSGWPWPEPRVRYDAGRVPQALIECGALLSISDVVDRGLGLLAWLDGITMSSGSATRFVGHLGLGPRDRLEDSGDEQPVEVAALAAAHLAAYRVTRDARAPRSIGAVLGVVPRRQSVGCGRWSIPTRVPDTMGSALWNVTSTPEPNRRSRI